MNEEQLKALHKQRNGNMIIAIDFDGTIVEHQYPDIGKPVPGAIEKMQEWYKAGHSLILWTMRSGEELADAVAYIESHGIKLFGANTNRNQASWTTSPKAYAKVYIDDAAYGCPLRESFTTDRPMVDWSKITLEE